MSRFEEIKAQLKADRETWLVTGCAGFIGSNLIEELLNLGQRVVGLDNFSTGHWRNLEDVEKCVGAEAWSKFTFLEGDICDLETCHRVCKGVDYVLHQAALGSVPRSIDDPIRTNKSNIDGFLNMLVAARDAKVRRFVYAASSSTYGDHPDLPKVEDKIGKSLSPYAVTKYVNELYADVFARTYGMESIGLRYFNIFGPRQDPNGAYAAVIPRWIGELLEGKIPTINGDGETSRDFTYIDNAVQANILAATNPGPLTSRRQPHLHLVVNIACGQRTSLNELFTTIRNTLAEEWPEIAGIDAQHGPFRAGDVKHSLADVSKARDLIGYQERVSVTEGLEKTVNWFCGDRPTSL